MRRKTRQPNPPFTTQQQIRMNQLREKFHSLIVKMMRKQDPTYIVSICHVFGLNIGDFAEELKEFEELVMEWHGEEMVV